MANELINLSDAELENEIMALREREESLGTESGRAFIVSKMRELIGLLETWGYKTDADEKGLAMLWAQSLASEFVRLGVNGMRKAVTAWAEADESPYRVFPKVAWIKNACREIGGDPRVEKGRREQAAREKKLEEDHARQMEHFRRTHPREWAEIEEKAKKLGGVKA